MVTTAIGNCTFLSNIVLNQRTHSPFTYILVLVLLRLWVIRNRNRIFICSTLILFVLAHAASITCVVIVLVNVTREHSPPRFCELDNGKIIHFIPRITDISPRNEHMRD